MSTTLSFLPPPKFNQPDDATLSSNSLLIHNANPLNSSAVAKISDSPVPKYGHRQGFIPRHLKDYGDGGAFPEIHVLQYPLDMGRNKTESTNSTVALQVDEHGRLRYDALARQGHESDALVLAEYKDLVPMKVDANAREKWTKPSQEEMAITTEKTKKALELIVASKSASIRPTTLASTGRPGAPTIVKYTPTPRGGQQGKTRIISLVEMPVDPLAPSEFAFKRLPAGPPSPPPPVLHSPPRKITKKERDEWNIPPCISNWKNAKGFTIPLDKRLAADGRGLQETVINDKFAQFSESLQIAERHAREEVRQRALMQQKISEKERQLREDGLRRLAEQAREERAGFGPGSRGMGDAHYLNDDISPSSRHHASDDDEQGLKEREAVRRDKQRELQRDYRMSHMGADARVRHAKNMEDRDISEKIALGIAKPSVSKDGLFDSRLYNQSEGLGSGFGNDEAYDLYDKPLFSGAAHGMSSVYRPSTQGDSEMYGGSGDAQFESLSRTDKFMPAPGHGFSGTDPSSGPRDGPVEFERAADHHYGNASGSKNASDLFGVNDLMSQGRRPRHDNQDDQRKSPKRSRKD